jgi:hypothetical protein
LELNGFRVVAVRDTADAVWEHALKRDAILCGLMLFVRLVRLCDCRLDLLSVGS